MKPQRLLALSLASALVASALAQSSTLTGTVSNAATRASLEGAVVTLSHSSIPALTDRTGNFEFTGVTPGTYTLSVSYTGLDAHAQQVVVSGGRTVVPPIGLRSDIYRLDAFTVAGEREGSAAAITSQRNASNIKAALATDAFGHIVDGNIGEMLKRVSGISTNLNEGEVDQIFVRGMGSAASAVTLDGTRLPSPASGKKTRNFEVDKLPADYIESIEVIKAPTPDMDADSVGGAVNLITKSAFSQRGRRLSYNTGVNYKTLHHKSGFFGGVQYSDLFGERKNVGLYLSVSYSDNPVPQDVTQLDFQGAAVSPAYMYRFRLEDALHRRNRTGVGAKVDWRVNDRTTVFVGAMFNHYTDIVDQKRLSIDSAQNVTAFAPGYTENAWEAINATNNYSGSLIGPRQETWAFSTGGKTVLPGWKIDYAASFAPAKGTEDRENFDLGLAGQRVRFDRTADVWYPTVTFLGPGNVNDYNRYNRGRLQAESGTSKEAVWGGELNVARSFATAHPLTLKTGFRYRAQRTDVDDNRTTATYVGPDGIISADDNLNQFKRTNYVHHGFDGRYTIAEWPDVRRAYSSFLGSRNLWLEDRVTSARDGLVNDGRAREDIYAAYIMSTLDVGRLRILPGLRMERTDVTATGVVNRPIAPALPGTAPEAQRLARLLAEYSRTTRESAYTEWFPGLHFRYAARKNLLLRASYTESMSRPSFGDLMPNTTVNDVNLTVSQNNTGLRPQRARNFDVSAELYFEPAGAVSVGAFRKDLKNFLFADTRVVGTGADNGFEGAYAGYLLSTRKNGGSGKAEGLEFSYNQQLTFLPERLRGFSLYATYTIIRSEGNYNSGGAVTDDQLAQFTPVAWNVGLTWQRARFTVRAQYNYNDRFLNAYNANAAARIYDDERIDGALNVKYQLRRGLALFCDWTNALDQTVVRVQGKDRYRPQKIRYNGMRFNFGVTGNF
ncbi:MAG: TonB-dependent receptor [Opitutaceae bacterium]|nr:TonB-dependent receptor [Opitutaceae bacterium]